MPGALAGIAAKGAMIATSVAAKAAMGPLATVTTAAMVPTIRNGVVATMMAAAAGVTLQPLALAPKNVVIIPLTAMLVGGSSVAMLWGSAVTGAVFLHLDEAGLLNLDEDKENSS